MSTTRDDAWRHALAEYRAAGSDADGWADLSEYARTFAETLEKAKAIMADLVDPDPCWFDHHGYCQAHGWMETEPVCPHARAKALLGDI